ncbi:sensor histidine kinase [Flavisolibacter tropicus]|uniref:histidine kinase n=1 Tax=Flavisolibacter tropicus TaxID=1492898 RepID=A0A172TYP1_9BACT|nr:HAMP domain-containing sensor histidine kinase [Flavisolibacter tropicus]ANE51994.1 histidine kinase [Flavisolibacter tropicus]
MTSPTQKQLRRATIVFWVLLCYIIAALVWWLISLEQQSHAIHDLQQAQVDTTNPVTKAVALKQWGAIESSRNRNSAKYLLEGATFLLLILFGAVYIYRLVRKQFQLQLQQQNFAMAITHELKTPLAVARLSLETIQKHKLDEERQRKLLDKTLQETLRLDTLINNILISSQLDHDGYKAHKEAVSLSEITRQLTEDLKHRYADKQVIENIDAGIHIYGDPLLLKLLVSNLLENANKYSGKQTNITCSLHTKDHKIVLEVSDEGIGISDEEKKMIFEKFYRVGNEQTRRTKGTGLGLYICKKIAQSHGGDIKVVDNVPQGSTFIVTFTA